MEWLSSLPHCALYGKPVLGALHVFGDLGTFLAYCMIPIAIEIVRYKKKMPFGFLAFLFASFIFLCGFGHLLAAVTTMTGSPTWYWWEGINKSVTALVSLATAAYAFKLVPVIVGMPTQAQYQELQYIVQLYRDAEKWRRFGKPLQDESPSL